MTNEGSLTLLGNPTLSESIRFFEENPYVTPYLTIDGRELTYIHYCDQGYPSDGWIEGDPPMMQLHKVEFNDQDVTAEVRGTQLEDEIMETFDLSGWEL